MLMSLPANSLTMEDRICGLATILAEIARLVEFPPRTFKNIDMGCYNLSSITLHNRAPTILKVS